MTAVPDLVFKCFDIAVSMTYGSKVNPYMYSLWESESDETSHYVLLSVRSKNLKVMGETRSLVSYAPFLTGKTFETVMDGFRIKLSEEGHPLLEHSVVYLPNDETWGLLLVVSN